MIKKHKKYLKPKQIFESERIKEENALEKKYGLRGKREIWKTQAKVTYFRSRAKALARQPVEEQNVLINKLKALGIKVESLADVLDLKVEDLLERRLPTIAAKKGLATTPLQARQMVVHKRILVNGKVLDAPSYLVPVSQEKSISLKKKQKKAKPKTEEAPAQEAEPQVQEEVKEEVAEVAA